MHSFHWLSSDSTQAGASSGTSAIGNGTKELTNMSYASRSLDNACSSGGPSTAISATGSTNRHSVQMVGFPPSSLIRPSYVRSLMSEIEAQGGKDGRQ